MNKFAPYRGRFAPSPSGELHFGSLIAAVASYLQARTQKGEWLLRIEDIDENRTVKHSDQHILQALELFGFEWDGDIVYQSQRKSLYQDYLDALIEAKQVFACDCTRSQLRQQAEQQNQDHAVNTTVYPGICRNKALSLTRPLSLRCLTSTTNICFNDQIQGHYQVNLADDCGDFIVKRRDGFFAYQLVVVIDDAEQGITDIVRGADLLSSTPQQIYLQQLLNLAPVSYAHLPVAMQKHGSKLSKSHQDLAVRKQIPAEILHTVFSYLQQSPPPELARSSVDEIWQWAFDNWDISQIRPAREIIID